MKIILLLALISIVLLPNFLIPPSVSADGGVYVDYYQHVYLPEQKAAIFWDGTDETLILSTKIRSENITNMAWVIPLPSKTKPEIEEGDIGIFYELAEIFAEYKGRSYTVYSPIVFVLSVPSLISSFISAVFYIKRKQRVFLYLFILFLIVSLVLFVLLTMWMGSLTFTFMGEGEVEPIEIKKVDIYDVATLKATNATALVRWLNDNGYTVPESTIPILQDYCNKENFYFIANKINLEDSRILYELWEGIATPLKITFQPDEPFYPQKISSINDGTTHISVYVISPSPAKDKSGILQLTYNRMEELVLPKPAGRLGKKYKNYYVTLLEYHGDLKTLQADSIFSTEEEIPLWMQWWFWTMVAAGIATLAGAVYFLKKRKPPTSTAPTLPREGTLQNTHRAYSCHSH